MRVKGEKNMALKIKKLHTPYGVTFEDVYVKVNTVSYDDTWEQGIIYIGLLAYLNEDARKAGLEPLPELQAQFNFPSNNKLGNLWEEAYAFLKRETAKLEGYTEETMEEYNKKRLLECMEANEPPSNMLIPEFLDFVGYEDC